MSNGKEIKKSPGKMPGRWCVFSFFGETKQISFYCYQTITNCPKELSVD